MSESLKKAVSWLVTLPLELALHYIVFLIIMELIIRCSDLLSRLFLGKPSALGSISPIQATLNWNRWKKERQQIEERAGRIRSIRRPPPPPEQSAAAEVIALRKKVKQRRGGWPEVRYKAGFRLKDGGEVWLTVPEQEFRRLLEGDAGLLTFQGTAFRAFQKFGEGASGP